jgi:hypothetical protein
VSCRDRLTETVWVLVAAFELDVKPAPVGDETFTLTPWVPADAYWCVPRTL